MAPPRSRAIRKPQQARSRRTLERVYAAALECFETHGFDATTTAMIADRAGIAVGTVYSYFPDKREILLELLDSRVSERVSMVASGLDPSNWGDKTPLEAVRAVLHTLFRTAFVQPGLQRIMWERYFKDPEFQLRGNALREQNRLAVKGFLEVLLARGLLGPIDPDPGSYVIVNAVQWNSTMVSTDCTPDQVEAVANAMTQMVERYIFRDEPPAPAWSAPRPSGQPEASS